MRQIVLAVLLMVGSLATVALGHAATLNVHAVSLGTVDGGHPCPATATATPSNGSGTTFDQVTVTLSTAACSGRTVRAAVRSGATLVVEGSAVVSGTTATLTVPTYTAGSSYTVAAVVSGWSLPTTWAFAAPANPITIGNSNTTLTLGAWFAQGTSQCISITVDRISAAAGTWEISLDTTSAPFVGATSISTSPGWPKISKADAAGVRTVTSVPGHDDLGSFTLCVGY